MKKLTLVLSVLLIFTLISGCTGTVTPPQTTAEAQTTDAPTADITMEKIPETEEKTETNTETEPATEEETTEEVTAAETEETASTVKLLKFVWNCYGVSSYDFETGLLIKTTDATDPEKFKTTMSFSRQQLKNLYDELAALDIESYPDEFDPYNAPDAETKLVSSPTRTLIVTAETPNGVKTVKCANICLYGKGYDAHAEAFLRFCNALEDMIYETPEWDALPEYEVLYD